MRFPVLSDAQIGYLAGIIDGEGSIGIYQHKRQAPKKGYAYSASLVISNTNRDLMDWLRQLIGCGAISTDKRGYNSKWKHCFHFTLYSNALRWLLPQIIPHLIVKKQQAILLNEWLGLTVSGYSSYHQPPEVLERRQKIIEELYALRRVLV